MILVVSNLFTRPSLVLFCLVTCLILTAVRTTQIASWGGSRKCSDLFHERRDCGYRGISQEACEKAHCCWRPAPDDRGIPWCFHPKEGQLMEAHYEVDSIQLMGKGRKIVLKHRFPHLEPTAEHTLVLEERHQKGIVNIKIKSAASAEEGYNPLESIFESFSGYPMPDQEPCRMDQSGLRVDISHGPFQLAVRRAEDHGSNALFSTAARTNEDSFNSIIFKDLFIQLGTHLPRGHNIYGLGECASRFRRSPRRMAFNNRDTPASINQNLYGAHPFYLEMRPNGRAHGVLMLTANPMEVDLGDDYLVYRMIGGQIDLYFFAGPTPDDVIEQYTRIVGRPPLYNPRFLGLHQCRFGYRTLDAWAEVVKGFEDAQLPLEGIWFDIE